MGSLTVRRMEGISAPVKPQPDTRHSRPSATLEPCMGSGTMATKLLRFTGAFNWREGEREREKEREAERDRERQRAREAERDREAQRERDRERGRERGRQRGRQRDRERHRER